MTMTEAGETRPLQAAGSIVAAMVLIGFIDTLVVLIAGIAGLWQFHLVRSLMSLPILFAVARAGGLRLRPRRWRPVALRSLFISLSMVLYFGALGFMPVGEAAAGLFTSPIFVLLISVAVFRERVGWRRALAVALGFAGVLLVLRPGAEGVSPAALMPITAALFYALAAIATRRWCAREGTLPLLAGFYVFMALWGTLGCLVLAVWQPVAPDGPEGFLLRGWIPPDATFLSWTAVQAVGSVLGIGLITRGYLLGEASYVAVFEYTLLIFAALWGWLLWAQTLTPLSLAGVALIFASGVVLTRRAR